MEVRRPDRKNGELETGEDGLEHAAHLDTVPTSAADVESAGRSCLAILILIFVIVVIAAVWFVIWSST